MDFLKRLIDWILSLFGVKKAEPSPPMLQAGAHREQVRAQALGGLDEVEGTDNIHVHGESDSARVVKSTPGADLVEEDGETQWVDRVNKDVPRQSWRDVWGPLARLPQDQRLEEFVLHEREFDMARQGDPLDAERKLLAFGYSSVGEFYHVRTTILKYHATPQGPNVGDAIIDSQQYINAVMRADARRRDAQAASMAQQNPQLLAPVEGVTVELYAQIAARIAQGMQQQELLALLAQHKLDYPTWDRASKVWNDRMSKDTTATIATIYGKAFMGAGQGQFGGAAQATAATNYNGSAAGGAAPIPYEKACEIQGAMSAWSKSGKDVNALLKSKFGMVAADWAAANTWWMTQLMADVSRFDDWQKRCDAYEKQYADSTGKADSDISF